MPDAESWMLRPKNVISQIVIILADIWGKVNHLDNKDSEQMDAEDSEEDIDAYMRLRESGCWGFRKRKSLGWMEEMDAQEAHEEIYADHK